MLSEADIDSIIRRLSGKKELTKTDRQEIDFKYYQLGKQKLYKSAFVAGRITEFEYYQLKAFRLSNNRIT